MLPVAAPPVAAIENNPCWNVCGVSFGPASDMPVNNRLKKPVPPDWYVPLFVPQYQLKSSGVLVQRRPDDRREQLPDAERVRPLRLVDPTGRDADVDTESSRQHPLG